jgi:hypothetical protein
MKNTCNLASYLRGRLFAWLLLRLKQPQQNKCLVTKKTQFIFGRAHNNSRLKHDFAEAAPSHFSSNSVSVNSAIHLHCLREQF